MMKKFVFIGGLHRSGTTFLNYLLQQHPDVSGFYNTGVNRDEGQFLQKVYPLVQDFGGVGQYAFHEDSHMTEDDVGDDDKELPKYWFTRWNMRKKVLLEKSPPNILKSRYLYDIFRRQGEVYFIIMKRHPLAVSLSTSIWRPDLSLGQLMNHWKKAHDIWDKDKKFINYIELNYEEFVDDPLECVKQIEVYLDLEHYEGFDDLGERVIDGNAPYKKLINRWDEIGEWFKKKYYTGEDYG